MRGKENAGADTECAEEWTAGEKLIALAKAPDGLAFGAFVKHLRTTSRLGLLLLCSFLDSLTSGDFCFQIHRFPIPHCVLTHVIPGN